MSTITNGVITTDFNGSNDIGYSIIVQSDGKLVVAGLSGNQFALVRYNPNGSLDTNFGSGGKVTTDFGAGSLYSNVMTLQSDGKLVVAGASLVTDDGTTDFAVVRYNVDGSLDTSFDGDGKVTTDLSFDDKIDTIIVQPDGKLVAGGHANSDFALVRYNTDGSLDMTFDGDGKVTTDFNSSDDYALSMLVQADGKLVVAGVSITSSLYGNSDFALARYNTNGGLDTTFDGDGKVITDIEYSRDYARSIVAQTDGKLVVAGNTGYGQNSNSPYLLHSSFATLRYNTNGSLDTMTFPFDINTGKLITQVSTGQRDKASSVIVQPDGKLVLAGSSTTSTIADFSLVRYDMNGILDPTFGSNGKVTTIMTETMDEVNALALQSDGKLVVAGYSANNLNPNTSDFVIARYKSDGSLDSTFNGMINNILTGTETSNVLTGTDGNEQLLGLVGNDTLFGLAGNDTLDGGANTDTVMYSGVRNNFTVQRATTGGFTFTVTDKTGTEGTDTLTGIEKIKFGDSAEIRLDISGIPGQAYRLYRAAFDRVPDTGGLGFWIDALDKGASLQTVANGFVGSTEFLMMYGLNATPETFLTKLYNNVLHRAYDQSGFEFWLGTMKSGANTQAAVLAQFSESPENQDATLGLIGNGVEYTPYSPIL